MLQYLRNYVVKAKRNTIYMSFYLISCVYQVLLTYPAIYILRLLVICVHYSAGFVYQYSCIGSGVRLPTFMLSITSLFLLTFEILMFTKYWAVVTKFFSDLKQTSFTKIDWNFSLKKLTLFQCWMFSFFMTTIWSLLWILVSLGISLSISHDLNILLFYYHSFLSGWWPFL